LIYTVQRVKLIAAQLRKFSDADSWIIAGQFSNLEFWMEETKAALKATDEHSGRFDKMYTAQKEWIELHTVEIPDNCTYCQGICELGTGVRKPYLPKRSKETKSEKKNSRSELIDASYFFLLRCYKLKLLTKEQLYSWCDELGTSVDLADI